MDFLAEIKSMNANIQSLADNLRQKSNSLLAAQTDELQKKRFEEISIRAYNIERISKEIENLLKS